MTAPASANGSVTTTDCHSNIANDGCFERWRVALASRRDLVFGVDSNFDSYLEPIRVDDLSDPVNLAVLLIEDDDSGPGLDAELSWTLEATTEYGVRVAVRRLGDRHVYLEIE